LTSSRWRRDRGRAKGPIDAIGTATLKQPFHSFGQTFVGLDERSASLVQAGAWLGAAQVGGLVGRVPWG